jgi:hypothetical protein
MTSLRFREFAIPTLALLICACDFKSLHRLEAKAFTFEAGTHRADVRVRAINDRGVSLSLCPGVEQPRAPPPEPKAHAPTNADEAPRLKTHFVKSDPNARPVPPGCAPMAGLSLGNGIGVLIHDSLDDRAFRYLKERPATPAPGAKPLRSYPHVHGVVDELSRLEGPDRYALSTTDEGWPIARCDPGIGGKGGTCIAGFLVGQAFIELRWYDPAGVPDQARLWELASAADAKLRTMLSPPMRPAGP